MAVPLEPRERAGPRTLSLAVCVIFLGTLAATGITDTCFPVQPSRRVATSEMDQAVRMREDARWLDGSRAELIEYGLRLTSRTRRIVSSAYSTTLFRTLGHLGRGTVRGSGDWMFLRERLQPPAVSDEQIAGVATGLLAAVERRVRAAGLDCAFLAIPRKGVVYADRLPRGVDPRARIDELLPERLAELGVPAPDLLRAFRGERASHELFYPCDTHWSPWAEVVAARETLRVAGRLAPEDARLTELHTQSAPTPERRFDILRWCDVRLDPAALAGRSDQGVEGCSLSRKADGAGGLPPALAPRPGAPILLCGTSNSASGDLADFLAHFSQVAVQDVSSYGARFLQTLREFLARRPLQPGVELVVVEFPVHQLFFELDEHGLVLPLVVAQLLVENPPGFLPDPAGLALSLEPELAGGDGAQLGRGWRRVGSLPAGRLERSGDGRTALALRLRWSRSALQLRLRSAGVVLPVELPRPPAGRAPELAIVLPLVQAARGAEPIVLEARARQPASLLVLSALFGTERVLPSKPR